MKDGKLTDEEDTKESALERAKKARMNMKGTRTFAPEQLGGFDHNQLMVTHQPPKEKKKKNKKVEEAPKLSNEEIQEQQKRKMEIQMQRRKTRHVLLMEQAPEVKQNVEKHDQAALQ